MSSNYVRITPLGGLSGIGKNCTIFETEQDIVVVDAGLQFPEDELLGVDLVIPDITYLQENQHKIRGFVITHGHEDHIGALPFVLREIGAPIYATPLTRGLIEVKLRNAERDRADLRTMLPGSEITLGDFRIMPYHVTHSIPDAVGLAIHTPLGLIVHSGDFKIDHTPIEGKALDLSSLARFSTEGVLLLLSDSTNAETPGYTVSESELVDTFEQVFASAPGRIIVTTFASLLSRIQLVIETAEEFGRRVALAGRSMEQNTRIAHDLGHLHYPPGTMVTLDQVSRLPDDEVCIIATGSQGEPNAALARMAQGRYRDVKLKSGDTVLISAKAIPGNETAIYRNVDDLFRRGANVVYGEKAGIHVSGHAAQEELKMLISLLQPRYFMPIHGAYRMLQMHANLAMSLGMPQDNIFIMENGDRLKLTHHGAELEEPLQLDDVYVDGALVGDVGATILRDRRALAHEGLVIARVTLNGGGVRLAEEPDIISQGFVWMPEAEDLIEEARKAIVKVVESQDDMEDTDALTRRIKRRLENLFYTETRRRPVVIPVISEA
ncbi:MAG: ribonuclease J [Anaerolineae bacterium]|nr:ribonuclease J [Anaerolineae bacterium]